MTHRRHVKLVGVLMLAVFDWLGDKPWGGDSPWWEILITVFGVFGGAFAGGRTIATSRVRSESRREVYKETISNVADLPTSAADCGGWVRSCEQLDLVAEVLTWAERRAVQDLLTLVPYDVGDAVLPSGPMQPHTWQALNHAALIRIAKRYHAVSDEFPQDVSQFVDRELLRRYLSLDAQSIRDKADSIEDYLARKLRPGWPIRRAGTFRRGVQLLLGKG